MGSKHVRILSALLPRAVGRICEKPYRLDMLRPLSVDGRRRERELTGSGPSCSKKGETVVNCASDEFGTPERFRYNWWTLITEMERKVETTLYDRKRARSC